VFKAVQSIQDLSARLGKVAYKTKMIAEAQHEGTVLLSENIVKENLQIVLVLLGEMILTATRIDN
jgi:hypothetical protein